MPSEHDDRRMSRLHNAWPSLSESDIAQLIAWRHELHRHPELSGEEVDTAARVVAMLRETRPDRIVTELGGHGVAAVYDSGQPGPRVLLRAELDALPISDRADVPHRSMVPGKGHLCGHDGHSAILAAVARLLGRRRPGRGAVVLMFQPAEEDGSGAEKVVNDPAFAELRPDFAFAIHNMPGMPLGEVAIADGPVTCASRGMRIRLSGRAAHASQPETGVSPVPVVASLLPGLTSLGSGGAAGQPEFSMATITHARLGHPAFGIAPGDAEIWVTLRALTDQRMQPLVAEAEALASSAALEADLAVSIEYADIFVACRNHPAATEIVRNTLDKLCLRHGPYMLPMRASEDFGNFGADCPMALMLLGAGDGPALHNPDYDFADALIGRGAAIWSALLHDILA